MKSITSSILLLVLCIGASHCVNWSNITAAELKDLPSSAFDSITFIELGSIPPEACTGFQANQVQNLPPSAIIGLQAACLAQFSAGSMSACSGFQSTLVQQIMPDTFSGFQPACIRHMQEYAFQFVIKEQFAKIPSTSCVGFQWYQVDTLLDSVAPAVSADCLADLSTSGCEGLKSTFVAGMAPDTFEGFSKECVVAGPLSMFQYINSAQLRHIRPYAFYGIGWGTKYIPDEAWYGIELQQMTYLRADAFKWLPPTALKIIVNKHKIKAVDMFSVATTAVYEQDLAGGFKSFIPSQVPLMTSWSSVSKDLSTVTWLKIALLEQKSDDQPVFDQQTLVALPFSALLGLRVDHVPLIAANDFKLFNVSHMQYFPNDTVSAISADQLREISPEAFGAISQWSFGYLNPSVIPAIMRQQIEHLKDRQINWMTCNQLQAFTMDQLDLFDTKQRHSYYETYQSQCGAAAPPIVSPVQSPTNAPSDTTQVPTTDSALSNTVVAALSVLVIIGAIVLLRRRLDPALQPLLSN